MFSGSVADQQDFHVRLLDVAVKNYFLVIRYVKKSPAMNMSPRGGLYSLVLSSIWTALPVILFSCRVVVVVSCVVVVVTCVVVVSFVVVVILACFFSG